MSLINLEVPTRGEGFYDITAQMQLNCPSKHDGVLLIFTPHTSCALTINESFDPTAKEDMEKFLKHLAPRNLKFIKHTAEGEDDSPSHMKSILLNQSLSLIVNEGKILLGRWQGIYLAEFRDEPHSRKVHLKFIQS